MTDELATAALEYRNPTHRAPDYAEIPVATRWAQVWVTVIGVIGAVGLLLGIGSAVLNMMRLWEPGLSPLDASLAKSAIFSGIYTGMMGGFLLAISATINLVASFGRAIRDIARNSHR